MRARSRLLAWFLSGFVCAATLLGLGSDARGLFSLDWNAGTGDWSTAQNWVDVGQLPGSPFYHRVPASFDYVTIGNGGTAVIGSSAWANYVWIGPGALEVLPGGALSAAKVYVGVFGGPAAVFQSGGSVTLSGALYIYSRSLYDMSGGVLYTPALQCGSGSSVIGAPATFLLSGAAELHADSEDVGKTAVGTFTQTGGTNIVQGCLAVGSFFPPLQDGVVTPAGTYELSGGQLETNSLVVGRGGTGFFAQTGGTNIVQDSLQLGAVSGAGLTGTGRYELSGTGVLQAASLTVGYGGSGTFVQTGGRNTIPGGSGGGGLLLGNAPGSTGSYELSGSGQLQTTWLTVGGAGSGTFVQTGGTVTIAGDVSLGTSATGSGRITVSGTSASHDIAGGLTVGGDGTGCVAVDNGGTLTTHGAVTIGRGGGADESVTVSSWGTWQSLSTNTLKLGNNGWGTLSIYEGGTVTHGGNVILGDTAAGRGRIVVGGPGASFQTTGSLVVHAGKLVVDSGGSVVVGGTYVQRADGILDVTLTDINRLLPAVAVAGQATLDGTLQIELGQGLHPVAGDRFEIMDYASLNGKFAAFTGSAIEGDPRLFLGLDYNKNSLSAMTLEVPTRADGTLISANPRSNLVLVTHGMNGTVGANNLGQVADEINGFAAINPPLNDNWDVVVFDWGEFAATGLNAREAKRRGAEIGRSLADWMHENGLETYSNVQLIGHSAGVWVIDSMVNGLHLPPNSNSQLTFLDAYIPDRASADTIGEEAGVAEQYFNRDWVPWTQGTLGEAVNVDVTEVPPGGGHGWPIDWYLSTIQDPNSGYSWGFKRSPMYRDLYPEAPGIDEAFLGSLIELPSLRITPGPNWRACNIAEQANVVSDTGTVAITTDGTATLTTGSPVMLTTFLDLDQPADLVSFDFQFLSQAEGLLSVFFSGDQILQIDERQVPAGLWSSGDVWLMSEVEPGTYPLLFRLDPYNETQSVVQISNLAVGLFPDPFALTWKGDTSGDWDRYTTANWWGDGQARKYKDGDDLVFDDTLAGTPLVNIAATVYPGSVLVNNTVDFVFSGPGSIAGPCGLTKSGSGTLILATSNTYTGGTDVSGGTLLAENATGSATGTGAVTVGAATLGGTGFIDGPVTLTGDSILTSTGTLTINNTLTVQGLANQLAAGTVTTSGDVTIEPGAVFIINGTLGGGTGELIVRGTLMGKGTIDKAVSIMAGGIFSPGAPSSIKSLSQVVDAEAPRSFSFEIGGPSPNYAAPQSSVNDVLRLTSETLPFANATGDAPARLTTDTVIDVYFLFNDPPEGQYKADFFAGTDFTNAISDATFHYWRLDPRGERLHNSNFFSPLDGSLVEWSVVPETAAFAGGTASGYITQLTVVPEPATLVLLAAGGLLLLRRR